MEDDWNLSVGQGLGPLRFGMDAKMIAALATAHGAITSERPMVQTDMEDMYRIWVDTLGEEEARKAMDIIAEANLDMRPRHLQIRETGVHLTFLDGGLEDIMVEESAQKLHVDGRAFFGAGFLDALRYLQDLNGELPFVRDVDCYFRAVEVTAFGFIRFQETSHEILFDGSPGGREAAGFSLGWRNTPRDQNEDLSGHRRVDLKRLPVA